MDDSTRGEAGVVARTLGPPATRKSLGANLRALGLSEGTTILVHSSLSALGWVVGGAPSVVLALEDVIGASGTLMMPAYSLNAPEPSTWRNPPVPESWWEAIRNEWPPFDRELSPGVHLGVIAEVFRHQRGTERSDHPSNSFCARGPEARSLLEPHPLDNSMGESSPLGRLYEHRGQVLLLGVDHSSNSSLHLAEYRAQWPGKPSPVHFKARRVRDGNTEEVEFHDLDLNSEDFGRLGEVFESTHGPVRVGPIGAGQGRLMDQRALVDFGVSWLEGHRAAT